MLSIVVTSLPPLVGEPGRGGTGREDDGVDGRGRRGLEREDRGLGRGGLRIGVIRGLDNLNFPELE